MVSRFFAGGVQMERDQSDVGETRHAAQVQIEDLQREIGRLNQLLKTSSRQSTTQAQYNSDLEGKYNDLAKNYNHAVQALENYKAEASRLSQDNKTLARRMKELRDKEDKDANRKSRQIEELTQQLNTHLCALNDSKHKIADLEGSERRLQQALSTSEDDNNRLKNDVALLIDTVISNRKQIADLHKEIQDLQAENSSSKRDHQRLTADYDLQKLETTSFTKGNNLEGVATQIAEFSSTYATWERMLTEVDAAKEAAQSLLSIRALHENLVAEYHKFKEHSSQAGHAMALLRKHEEQYQDQTERLHIFIEKKLIPESEDYNELLVSTSDIAGYLFPNKIKCFISCAWEPNRSKNAVLQTRLIKIKEDLEKSGVEVLLDIHNMEGDINRYMTNGIHASDRILIICTPRFKQRSEETLQTPNNLQKELEAALQKQQVDPRFIIPLILDGDRSSSVAKSIENILSLDFTDRKKYCENMVLLTPKGLLPMILGLERNRLYAQLLRGYLATSKKR